MDGSKGQISQESAFDDDVEPVRSRAKMPAKGQLSPQDIQLARKTVENLVVAADAARDEDFWEDEDAHETDEDIVTPMAAPPEPVPPEPDLRPEIAALLQSEQADGARSSTAPRPPRQKFRSLTPHSPIVFGAVTVAVGFTSLALVLMPLVGGNKETNAAAQPQVALAAQPTPAAVAAQTPAPAQTSAQTSPPPAPVLAAAPVATAETAPTLAPAEETQTVATKVVETPAPGIEAPEIPQAAQQIASLSPTFPSLAAPTLPQALPETAEAPAPATTETAPVRVAMLRPMPRPEDRQPAVDESAGLAALAPIETAIPPQDTAAVPEGIPSLTGPEAAPKPFLTTEGLSLFVHAPVGLRQGDLETTETFLNTLGLDSVYVGRTSHTIRQSNVRFYHARDRDAATALADAINADLRDFSAARPAPPTGTIEVWLSGRGAPRITTEGAKSENGVSLSLRRLRASLEAFARGSSEGAK
ncbi:MAG: hypothetical protein AAGF74_02685 [Pseudomonadota bacterium]